MMQPNMMNSNGMNPAMGGMVQPGMAQPNVMNPGGMGGMPVQPGMPIVPQQ
jgi:hypothetical protein